MKRNPLFSFHPGLETPRQRRKRGAVAYDRRVAAALRKERARWKGDARHSPTGAMTTLEGDVASALREQGYPKGAARKAAQSARGENFESRFRDALGIVRRANPMSKKKKSRKRKKKMPAGLARYWAKKRRVKNSRRRKPAKRRRTRTVRNSRRRNSYKPKRRATRRKRTTPRKTADRKVTFPISLTGAQSRKVASFLSRNFKPKGGGPVKVKRAK